MDQSHRLSEGEKRHRETPRALGLAPSTPPPVQYVCVTSAEPPNYKIELYGEERRWTYTVSLISSEICKDQTQHHTAELIRRHNYIFQRGHSNSNYVIKIHFSNAAVHVEQL